MLINVKMPTIDILTFMSRIIFMLIIVKLSTSFGYLTCMSRIKYMLMNVKLSTIQAEHAKCSIIYWNCLALDNPFINYHNFIPEPFG